MSSSVSSRIALISSVGLRTTRLIVECVRHFYLAPHVQIVQYIMSLLKMKKLQVPLELIEPIVSFKAVEGMLTSHHLALSISAQRDSFENKIPAFSFSSELTTCVECHRPLTWWQARSKKKSLVGKTDPGDI